jgi:hypothetical protein
VKIDVDAAARAAVPAAARRAVRAQPLICTGCGQRIYRSRENYQEHVEDPYRLVVQAWHVLDRTCGPP